MVNGIQATVVSSSGCIPAATAVLREEAAPNSYKLRDLSQHQPSQWWIQPAAREVKFHTSDNYMFVIIQGHYSAQRQRLMKLVRLIKMITLIYRMFLE
jgi:nitroimidazol reductase NimA-like FMN-containing flavoprotein (pyridoxamine 5'-phosphate oxidase superfamily)